MSSVDATLGAYEEGSYAASTRQLTTSEIRDRIGEAIYGSIDLEAPEGMEEGIKLFEL